MTDVKACLPPEYDGKIESKHINSRYLRFVYCVVRVGNFRKLSWVMIDCGSLANLCGYLSVLCRKFISCSLNIHKHFLHIRRVGSNTPMLY